MLCLAFVCLGLVMATKRHISGYWLKTVIFPLYYIWSLWMRIISHARNFPFLILFYIWISISLKTWFWEFQNMFLRSSLTQRKNTLNFLIFLSPSLWPQFAKSMIMNFSLQNQKYPNILGQSCSTFLSRLMIFFQRWCRELKLNFVS